MSNIQHLRTQGQLDRWLGAPTLDAPAAPTIEDITAMIRKVKLSPEDCMVLLTVMGGNLSDQKRDMEAWGISASFAGYVKLSDTGAVLDACHDEISNVEGVTI